MIGAPQLLEDLEPPPTPRLVGRQAQATEDDSINLLAQQQLGQGELLMGRQRRHGFVTNAEKHAPRKRLHIVLDLLLDEQLVFVSD